jgi:hypothetical protein
MFIRLSSIGLAIVLIGSFLSQLLGLPYGLFVVIGLALSGYFIFRFHSEGIACPKCGINLSCLFRHSPREFWRETGFVFAPLSRELKYCPGCGISFDSIFENKD